MYVVNHVTHDYSTICLNLILNQDTKLSKSVYLEQHPIFYSIFFFLETRAFFVMVVSSYDKLVKGLSDKEILNNFLDVTPLVNDINAPSSRPNSRDDQVGDKKLFDGQDAEQIKLMEEVCIVVDYNDVPIGAGSKKTCKFCFSFNLFHSQNPIGLDSEE